MREYADPSMAAISVIYIVVTATLLTLAMPSSARKDAERSAFPLNVRLPLRFDEPAIRQDIAVRFDGVTKRFGA